MAETEPSPASDAAAADPATPVQGWSGSPTIAPPAPEPEQRRRRRPNRWERPKPPHDWRFWVGGLGRVLIVAGLLLLGFVAYQLWGTGIETARAQRGLESDFEELLASTPAATVVADPADSDDPADEDVFIAETPDEDDSTSTADAPATTTAADDGPGTATDDGPDAADDDDEALDDADDGDATDGPPTAVPVEQQVIPLVENGDALARLEIPKLGTDHIVVAGVDTTDLKKGPGHFPETPLPGQLGNSAIAGHRTTYGQPFHNVDQLDPGDEMIVTTLSGTFVYVVTDQEIVTPSDYHVISTTDPTRATLALVSCDPKWTAENRIIIHGVLDPERSAQVGEPVLNYGKPPEEVSGGTDAVAGGDLDTDTGSAATSSGGVTGSLLEADDIDERVVGVDALTAGTASAGVSDAFSEGWFSDSGAHAQVVLWALVLIAIWAGAYLLARHFRRTWVGVAAATVPFLVALYFFYQNVNRMLPPNL